MLRTATLSLLLAPVGLFGQTITQSNFSFNPNVLTVTAGTEITVTLGSPHTFTQVSQATWNANGSTPLPGGFNFNAGTHQLTLDIPGTYYYVCVPHAGMGMKGQIIVESNTGIVDGSTPVTFTIAPNPANDLLTVTADPSKASVVKLMDLSGREVLAQRLTGNDRISISQLPEGNYVAVVLGADGSMLEQRRLVIKH